MNEQYITLVGKVCSPRYEEVYTPEVKSKLPIEASSEGRNLKDYTIYGNNNPNHVDESQSTLPVSIDTYGGNAVDWEIFGNNNPVVENKASTLPIDASATAGNLLDWTINGNNNSGKNVIQLGESQTVNGVTLTIDSQAGTVIMNGDTTSAEAGFSVNLFDTSSLVGGDYIFSGGADGGSLTTYDLYLYNRTDQVYVGRLYNSSDIISATIESGKRYTVYVQCRKGQVYNNIVFKPMLRPANTTSTFEPYTVGVGERTKNLISVSNIESNTGVTIVDVDEATGSIKLSSSVQYRGTSFYFSFEDGKTYTISAINNVAISNARIAFRQVGTNSIISSVSLSTTGVKTATLTFSSTDYPNGVYVSLICNMSGDGVARTMDLSNLMLVEGNTAPESFIPYGYKIPMQAKQRTKNLYNITNAYCLNAGVTVQEENGRLHIFGNSTNNANHIIGILVGSLLTQISLEAGQYVLSGAVANTNSNYRIQLLYINPDGSAGAIIGYDSGDGLEFTLEEPSTVYMRIYVKAAAYQQDVDLLFSPMIRRADTSSDFEPYYNINQTDIYIGNSPLTQGQTITKSQSNVDLELFSGDNIIDTTLVNKPQVDLTYRSSVLGVGEKTSNLYDKNAADTTKGYVLNKYLKYDGSIADNSVWIISEYINISGGSQIYLTYTDGTTTSVNASVAFYDSNHTFISGVKYNSQIAVSAPIPTNAKYCRFSVLKANSGVAVLSLVSFSSYVPFGYQIPLLVTSGQQSTPHTIYIGDSPLTAGQSVNKTSSGADIALYQGNNTISTTLGNKPEMKIDYLSAEVGVGERTKNYVTWDNVDDTQYNVRCYGENGYLRLVGTYQSDTVHSPFRSYFQLPAGSYVLSGAPDFDELPIRLAMYTYVGGVSNYTTIGYDQGNGLSFTLTEDSNCFIGVRLQSGVIGVPIDLTLPCMVRPADTTSEFEPYGYKVPVKVYDDEDNSETYDVYIGSQLLVSGASVNKDGTGVDIELNEGVNTIKTDLYNEPEMYIK